MKCNETNRNKTNKNETKQRKKRMKEKMLINKELSIIATATPPHTAWKDSKGKSTQLDINHPDGWKNRQIDVPLLYCITNIAFHDR